MESFIGAIMGFGGTYAPRNWSDCNGALLAINSNQALFSILGTMYGGDGRTTFGLPDLRGRIPISEGTGPGLPTYRQGQRGGSPSVVLTILNLPEHSHTASLINGGLEISSDSPSSTTPSAGAYLASTATAGVAAVNAYTNAAGTPTPINGVTGQITVNNTGGSQAVNTQSPYLAIRWIIALEGVFPPRP